MRFKTLLTALLFSLLSLVSCRKDKEPVQTKQQTIAVNWDGTATDEFRVFHSHPSGQGTSPFLTKDLEYKVRVFLRYGEHGPVSTQDLWFTATNNRSITYKGDITLPPQAAGKLRVAAVLLGDKNGNEFVRAGEGTKIYNIPSGILEEDRQQKTIQINIPYISLWEDINISQKGDYTNNFKFTPCGTLFQIRFENGGDGSVGGTGEYKTEPQLATIESPYMFLEWFYDFANLDIQDGKAWGQRVNPNETSVSIPIMAEPTTQMKQKTKWYYICVMPTKQQPTAAPHTHAPELPYVKTLLPVGDSGLEDPDGYINYFGSISIGKSTRLEVVY